VTSDSGAPPGVSLLVLLAIAACIVLVATGPAELRPWRCHHAAERSSPREAADGYYSSCWRKPNRLIGPSDGGKGSTAGPEGTGP